MVRIGRHPTAGQFGVDLGAAGLGAFPRLQDQHARTGPENEPETVLREGAAGVRGHHAHALPGLQDAQGKGGFATAGDGHLSRTAAHHPQGLPQRVIGRGASRRDGERRPRKSEAHRNLAGAGAGHGARNRKGMEARFVVGVEITEALVFGDLAA